LRFEAHNIIVGADVRNDLEYINPPPGFDGYRVDVVL
jgi:hypothetical protein